MVEASETGWARYAGALGRSVRALVVDDEEAVREVLSSILADSGFEVDEAGEGNEAFSLVNEAPFDLAVIDKNLPGQSGVELLADMRQAKLEVPSVLITGFPSTGSISSALRAGARDYIAKPFDDIEQVRRRLNSVCAEGIEAKIYAKIVARSKAALIASRGEASVVAQIGRELYEHKQEMRLKTDVLLLQKSEVISDVLAGALALEGISVEERSDVEGALSLISSADALTAIISLETENALELIHECRVRDPLLQILVTSSAAETKQGLAAISHRIDDLVLRSEGTEILQVRARRLVHKARQKQMNLFLIGTLLSHARAEGFSDAEGLIGLLPPAEHALVEGFSAPVTRERSQQGDGLEPDLIELTEIIEEAEHLVEEPREGARVPAPPPPANFDAAGGPVSGASPEGEVPPVEPTAPQGTPEESEATTSEGHERRRYKRHEISISVRLVRLPDRKQTLHTFTRDISALGLFAIDAAPPPAGTRYEIELRPDPAQPPVKAIGTVVRSNSGRHAGMGLLVDSTEGISLQALIDRLETS